MKSTLFALPLTLLFACSLPDIPTEASNDSDDVQNFEGDDFPNDLDELCESSYYTDEEVDLYYGDDYEREEYPELKGEKGDVFLIQEADGDYKAAILLETKIFDSFNYWGFILTYVETKEAPSLEQVYTSQVQGYYIGEDFCLTSIGLGQKPNDVEMTSNFKFLGHLEPKEVSFRDGISTSGNPDDFACYIDEMLYSANEEREDDDPQIEVKEISELFSNVE